MRTEEEIYELILNIAKKDNRIKAVYMNGSRTNVNVPRDMFQDYDIVYVVEETASFIQDREWIRRFGDIMYMQYPDESSFFPNDIENHYAWLMQFQDGVRIDLTVQTCTYAAEHITDDKLCKILLDKENILPRIEEATDRDYHIQRFTQEQFAACCNEFWWCTNNIAKGLWREEMPYVQDMTNFVVRKELERMLLWKVGLITDFSVSAGKSAKYLYRWLTKEEYQQYLDTYFGGDVGQAWNAVYIMCDLFEKTAKEVAEKSAFVYNEHEGRMALKHMRDVQNNNIKLENFKWTREPKEYKISENRVEIVTNPYTDLWQRTYYHFRNDNAPVFQVETEEKYFSFVVKAHFEESHTRFDQCGIVMYLDSENWLKGSVEFENEEYQHLGSVVTNNGYSDWATTEISSKVKSIWYRFSRREDDYCIECSEDGVRFKQMRICHMHKANGKIQFGIYACSPENSSFKAVFTDMKITECMWKAHDGQQPDE